MTFLKQHTESCGKPARNNIRSFSDVLNAVYFKAGKRILDISLAATGLILLSPLFVVISFSIWLECNGHVLFHQRRPGLHGKIFVIYKFRTLAEDWNSYPETARSPPILPLGQFLRRFSLDEIPQLWNVVKGDMSLIGPRPLLPEYLELYSASQRKRHNVLPGLTGWAQINGRNAISWERKFELDVWYVENRSFALDMKILYRTLLLIFKRNGAQTASSFEKFKGNF